MLPWGLSFPFSLAPPVVEGVCVRQGVYVLNHVKRLSAPHQLWEYQCFRETRAILALFR